MDTAQDLVWPSVSPGEAGTVARFARRGPEPPDTLPAAHLMLHGVTAVCPDCGDERILLEVDEAEFCCTACDAAVLMTGAQEPLHTITGAA